MTAEVSPRHAQVTSGVRDVPVRTADLIFGEGGRLPTPQKADAANQAT